MAKHQCQSEGGFTDFDGSQEWWDCKRPATHRAHVIEDAFNGPERVKLYACRFHGTGEFAFPYKFYRFRRIG